MATKGKPAAPRLGIHIRTAAGLLKGARHALEIGCDTFQIMSGNPSAWNLGLLDPNKASQFRLFLDENRMRPVFLHAGYLINLSCRTGRNAAIYAKSIQLLRASLERALALSCEFVVVHLGSRKGAGRDESLAALVDGFCRLEGERRSSRGKTAPRRKKSLPAGWPMLLLENSAGSGESVGSTFEELALILNKAGSRGARQPLGICLDTAHLWGAGFDLSSTAGARRLVEDFDRIVGTDNLHLIHLNDSPVERGSMRDRHEHPGRGIMSLPALRTIVRHPKLRHVAMILETPGSTNPTDEERMKDLRKLAGRA